MSNSESMYKELSLFNDINNPSHKAWNRLMTVTNLKEQGRNNDASNYLEKLDESGKAAIAVLLLAIKKKGLDTVKAEVNRGIAVESKETI